MEGFIISIVAFLSLLCGAAYKADRFHAERPAWHADTVSDQRRSLDTITARLVRLHMNVRSDGAALKNILIRMQDNGSFNDIDYTDTSMVVWKPLEHLERLAAMSVAYRSANSGYYRDKQLLACILSGLDFYKNRNPSSKNWWYRDIGAPQVLMVPLLLLKGLVDQPVLEQYSAILKDAAGNPSHNGKNRTWVSEITIYKGCIEDNYHLVEKGFRSIVSTLVVNGTPGAEGIQPDNTFHQHHAQLYSGGYGMSIISDYAKYIALSRQTVFADAFTKEKRKLLSGLLLKGHRLLGYRHAMDFGSAGRNISRVGGTENIGEAVLDQMEEGDPPNAAAYQKWKRHLQGAAFPEPGNTYFWRSDIMVQHGMNSYLSAKIITNRTYGTESLNGENVKGYNLPLGSTNIMVNGKEYFNLFPVWNWSLVPGTTAELNDAATSLQGYQIGSNTFGGGVTDGRDGAIAYEHFYRDISAKKAYFFVDGMMLCLGTGISARKQNPVVTSINQCYADGPVNTGTAGGESSLNVSEQTFTGLKWLYHANVGYIFPQAGNVTVKKAIQSGSWRTINNAGDDKALHIPVFSAWFDHGDSPDNGSYCYIVAPDIKLPEFKRLAAAHKFKIIRNDTLVQAIQRNQTLMAVFYKSGILECGDGLKITVNAPAAIMMGHSGSSTKLTVSDPAHQQKQIEIRLSRKLYGPGAGLAGDGSKILIPMPQGDFTGKPVSVTLYTKAESSK